MNPKSREEKNGDDDGGEPKGSGRSGPMILRWEDRPGNGESGSDEMDQTTELSSLMETRQIRSGKDEANLGGERRPSVPRWQKMESDVHRCRTEKTFEVGPQRVEVIAVAAGGYLIESNDGRS